MKLWALLFQTRRFLKFHFKTYLLTLWPIYATNWIGLSNFDRGPSRDHSCEVWSKEEMLFKEIVDGRTDARTHARTHARTLDGRRTPDTLCSGELKRFETLNTYFFDLQNNVFGLLLRQSLNVSLPELWTFFMKTCRNVNLLTCVFWSTLKILR